jgi:hypothetical protein
VRSPQHESRRRPRVPIKRTPEELALAHADALRWRASLRDKPAGGDIDAAASAPMQPVEEAPGSRTADAAERARFAAAIARAEFGRFYFKDDSGKAPSRRRPGRNGKIPP